LKRKKIESAPAPQLGKKKKKKGGKKRKEKPAMPLVKGDGWCGPAGKEGEKKRMPRPAQVRKRERGEAAHFEG